MDFWYRPFGLPALLLAPLSLAWGLVTRLWHLAWDLGLRQPVRVEGAKVLSVGNLVAGGAGKTPAVIFLATEAQKRGHRVAVLSRGYGRTARSPLSFTGDELPPVSEAGDEPRLIARRCPGVTVYVGADRVASARAAVAAGHTLVILDDGFQHRRLARDVDVLVDAGDGNGWVLPAGPLREPASGRRRATHVWARDGRPGDLQVTHSVTHYRDAGGVRHALANTELVLLLGVARPDRVKQAVEAAGARVRAMFVFADHHVFTDAELAAARAAGGLLATTEKDAERLPDGHGLAMLELDVQVKGSLPIP